MISGVRTGGAGASPTLFHAIICTSPISSQEAIATLMHVEFFGVPRARAGLSRLELQAETLGQMLQALAVKVPSLGAGRLHPSFIASLNGDRFVSDPSTPLGEDDCVLILSADAGG
jgi:molybdopterin converting factor small subunit